MLPDFKPPLGSMLWKLANTVRELFTDWDEVFLGPYESALGPIGDNLSDEINALTGGLKDEIEAIFGDAMKLLKNFILRLILEQYDFFGVLSSGLQSAFDEQTFFWSDMLHYRETYRFGAELWRRASELPDAEQRGRCQAFALGWMTHLATDVTGHAFVNEKAGGPYRLHWQRHHLVENHMDSLVYNTEHGSQAIYQEMSNAALHLWLAFNPDGSSRNDFFQPEPNPPYPDGDHSADIVGRHAVWDVDSDMPEDLAQFLSDTLKAVFVPSLTTDPTGPVACCPTIISTLDQRTPIQGNGYAEKDDIVGAYWWLFKYLKWVTTDYYSIRRPDPPDAFVIPSFPSPPGSGDSDPGPGASSDESVPEDVLDFLLLLLAWTEYIGEIMIWPAAVVAGIVAGSLTYGLRELLYEYFELPLYNLWLAIHTYLAMTGYVMPMPGEINPGLTTLGVAVGDNWVATVAAMGTFDGGVTPSTLPTSGAESTKEGYPRDVLVDPPSWLTSIVSGFGIGAPPVNGQMPSEYTRPWRFPLTDNEGNAVDTEQPSTVPGPYELGQDANVLFGAAPGSNDARRVLESAINEADTIEKVRELLRLGEHLGDPVDYAAYVIAGLTRDGVTDKEIANFNLDADRGYAYLAWDWVRDHDSMSIPNGFLGNVDPQTGAATPVSQHEYPTPAKAGYGWDSREEEVQGHTPPFNPDDPNAAVGIRYIDKEAR
jgi:Zinc dependent phospholipase C